MTRPTHAEINDMRARLCADDIDLVALCDAYLELEAELQQRKDGAYECLLTWRGLELADACNGCGGSGIKTYGDTTTWHGGAGGQMLTGGVCNVCWGSGNDKRPWMNLKVEASRMTKLEAENAALKSILHDFHARMMDTYDGSPGSNNRMPFTGSDLYELERVLKDGA